MHSMNGLILKCLREIRVVTIILCISGAVFQALLAYLLPTFVKDLTGIWLQVKVLGDLVKALTGADVDTLISPGALASIAWTHPVALAPLWAQAIITCTRIPAGEIDRATIDVLLGFPISRWRLYLTDSMVCFSAGVVVVAFGFVGNFTGRMSVEPELRGSFANIGIVVVNLYLVFAAVAGLACLVSSLSDSRGRAIGIVFGCVLASFLLNFLAQFWEPAKKIAFLGLLNYYRPVLILRDGHWPIRDLIVLGAAALGTWCAGGLLFSRRNITTV